MNALSAARYPQVTDSTIDFAAIKRRQQATWESGDFAVIGTTLQIVGGAARPGSRCTRGGAGTGRRRRKRQRLTRRSAPLCPRDLHGLRAPLAGQGRRARQS
jgi:hypothetical protein